MHHHDVPSKFPFAGQVGGIVRCLVSCRSRAGRLEDSLERHTLMDDYRPPALFGEGQLCSGAEWGVCRPWFACA